MKKFPKFDYCIIYIAEAHPFDGWKIDNPEQPKVNQPKPGLHKLNFRSVRAHVRALRIDKTSIPGRKLHAGENRTAAGLEVIR